MTEASIPLSLNDEPVLDNAFNDAFIKRLSGLITDCRPPKNIAVTGYWGTGKTSALKQLYFHVSGELPPGVHGEGKKQDRGKIENSPFLSVWFDAWLYQHEEQPIVALLHEIRTKMGIYAKLFRETEKLGTVSLLGALKIFDDVIAMASGGKAKLATGKIMGIGEQYEQEHYLSSLPREAINRYLQQAINDVLAQIDNEKSGKGGKKRKLVIFIDDLDRCLPGAALRLLEGIKIYLNLNNCIVVFGMDHRQLEQSLQKELPGAESEDDDKKRQTSYYAREYLEKICQDIHYLPVPNQKEKSGYFLELLKKIDCGDPNRLEGHDKFLWKLLGKHDCLPANPRKIKILVNRTALVLRAISPPADDMDKNRWYTLMLVVVIIYVFHKPVYEQLDKNPAYINEVCACSHDFGMQNDERMQPMQDIIPSRNEKGSLPVNPSDANVWRLHELLASLEPDPVTGYELKSFLRLL